MPFKPIESQRLYQQVAEQIAAIIRQREFAVGDRLPAERELSLKLGVSRPTVREAMIALELAGFVDVRTGAGTYVVSSDPANRSLFRAQADTGPGPLELIDARLMVEPQVAARAARSIGIDQIQELHTLIDTMMAAGSLDDHRKCDREFHVLIARATGNGVLASMVDDLWSNMFTPVFERLRQLTGLVTEIGAETHDQHRAIVAAIAAGDAQGAETAMRTHLEDVRRVLLGDGVRFRPLPASKAMA